MRGLTTGAVHLGHARAPRLLRGDDRRRRGGGHPAARRPASEVTTPAERNVGVAAVRPRGTTMERMPVTTHRSDLDRSRARPRRGGAGGDADRRRRPGRQRRDGGGVGTVARSYPTPAAARGLGVRHLGADLPGLPRLRGLPGCCPASGAARCTGRRAGGWRPRPCFNMAWILAFSARYVLLAELLILALLVVLARGVRPVEPGTGRRYGGAGRRCACPSRSTPGGCRWRSWPGRRRPGSGWACPATARWPTIAAVLILLVARASSRAWSPTRTAVVGYAAAVVWALAGIALNDPPAPVGVAAAVAVGRRAVRHGAAGQHGRRPPSRRLGLSRCSRRVRARAGRSPVAQRGAAERGRRVGQPPQRRATRVRERQRSSDPSPGAASAVTVAREHGRDRPDRAARGRIEVREPVAVGADAARTRRPSRSSGRPVEAWRRRPRRSRVPASGVVAIPAAVPVSSSSCPAPATVRRPPPRTGRTVRRSTGGSGSWIVTTGR